MKGEEIPISAQVVSLADVYDALVSDRVYKKAYSHEKAIEMILNGECGMFNPFRSTEMYTHSSLSLGSFQGDFICFSLQDIPDIHSHL